MPPPDVEAVAFELRSLCTSDCLTLPGDLQSLIQRLHIAQVHLVALHVSEEACAPSTVTCGDGAADHACHLLCASTERHTSGAGRGELRQRVRCRGDAEGARSTAVASAERCSRRCAVLRSLSRLLVSRCAPLARAVVAGASALHSLLAACAAADLQAVLLSASRPPPLLFPAVAHAARAADVPRALAQPGDLVVGAALSETRVRSLLRAAVMHPLPRRGLCLLFLDLRCSLAAQAPWHVLLHKATDALAGDAHPGVLPLLFTRTHPAPRLSTCRAHATPVPPDQLRWRLCASLRLPSARRG